MSIYLTGTHTDALDEARLCEADARQHYYTMYHVGSPDQIEQARQAYQDAMQAVCDAELEATHAPA